MEYGVFGLGMFLSIVGVFMILRTDSSSIKKIISTAKSTESSVQFLKSDIQQVRTEMKAQADQVKSWADAWIEAQKKLSNRCFALDEKLTKQDEIFTNVWNGIDACERRLKLDVDLLKQKVKPVEQEKLAIDLIVWDGEKTKTKPKAKK